MKEEWKEPPKPKKRYELFTKIKGVEVWKCINHRPIIRKYKKSFLLWDYEDFKIFGWKEVYELLFRWTYRGQLYASGFVTQEMFEVMPEVLEIEIEKFKKEVKKLSKNAKT